MQAVQAQFAAASWMDQKIFRPSNVVFNNGRLYWKHGRVQEVFAIDVDASLSPVGEPRQVITANERKPGELSIEEELERERQRNRSIGVDAFHVSAAGDRIVYRSNGKWFLYLQDKKTSHELFSAAVKGFPTNVAFRKDLTECSFTCNGNVFLASIAVDAQAGDAPVVTTTPVTVSGGAKGIDCGAADYIVSEEFGRLTGHWVSDGHVLFTVSDTSSLPTVSILKADGLNETMPYPRVGDVNPIVYVAVWHRTTGTFRCVPQKALDKACGFAVEYIPRLGIIGDESIYLQCLSRDQEHACILKVAIADLVACASDGEVPGVASSHGGEGIAFTTVHRQDIPWAWVEITDALWLSPTEEVVGQHAVSESPDAPYFHLYRKEGDQWRPLTRGAYNVTHSSVKRRENLTMFHGGLHDYLGSSLAVQQGDAAPAVLTAADEFVYTSSWMLKDGSLVGIAYVAASETTHAQLFVQPVNADGSVKGPRTVVPTGWDRPAAGLWPEGSPVSYPLVLPTLHRPVNRRGVALPTFVYLPKNSPLADANGRVPVYVYVYGGPHVQLVKRGENYEHAMNAYFQTILHRGFAVLVIDNQMCHANHLRAHSICKRNMGHFEVEDYTDAIAGLCADAALGAVLDRTRIAINGASYGGYASLLALAQAPDVFRLGFAEAPVGDWRLYDTGYTERYMGLLPADEAAYARGAIPALVQGFPDEPMRLFISHGLTDENVHFGNTCAVVDALIAAAKPFYMDVYPGERHGLRQKPQSIPHRRSQVILTMEQLLK